MSDYPWEPVNIIGSELGAGSRQIQTFGFQGTGARSQYVYESTLIKVGHVGISFDSGKTIYGFHPTPAAVTAFIQGADEVTEKDFIRFLQNGGVLRGGVFDDTAIFERAATLSAEHPRTQVWHVTTTIVRVAFLSIQQNVLKQVVDGSPFPSWYGFPQVTSACNNCATWPGTLGLALIENSGVLTDYIAKMRELGAQWP